MNRSDAHTGFSDPADDSAAAAIDWPLVARCLTVDRPGDTAIFEDAVKTAGTLGATPFEVIAGTPATRYGPRITFRVPPDSAALLAQFGLAGHHWGEPEWLGLRVADSSELVAKAYHPIVHAGFLPFQEKISSRLYPVMASLHRGAEERYLRFRGTIDWCEFAEACLAPLNLQPRDFSPLPKPVESGFCVSVRYHESELESVSLLADYRALPDDETIQRLWSQGMCGSDMRAYELALAAVRSSGQRRLGSWHAMLSWTLERDGTWHRAASLRFPSSSGRDKNAPA